MPGVRAPSPWPDARPLIASWVSSCSLVQIEQLGRVGYDAVVIDMQHGSLDYREVVAALIALSGSATSAFVRVPSAESGLIGRLLDAGADGVMCPTVDTAAEAAGFVAACRYPPDGERSFGPLRAALGRDLDEYFEAANREVVTIAQIETAAGLENVAAIAATPGLDCLFIGTWDLSISVGEGPGQDYGSEAVAERHRRIVDAAKQAGVRVGLLGWTPDEMELTTDWGADMLIVADDLELLIEAASARLEQARSATRGGMGAAR